MSYSLYCNHYLQGDQTVVVKIDYAFLVSVFVSNLTILAKQ